MLFLIHSIILDFFINIIILVDVQIKYSHMIIGQSYADQITLDYCSFKPVKNFDDDGAYFYNFYSYLIHFYIRYSYFKII